MILNPLNRRSEDIRITPMVVAELKLRDVKRHILGADFMERADDTTLEDAPKTLNRVGMHRADNVTLGLMFYGLARLFGQAVIDKAFIGREQGNLVGYHFADKAFSGGLGDAVENAGDHVTLTLHCADHWRFAGRLRTSLCRGASYPNAGSRPCRQPTFRQLLQCRQASLRAQ